MIQNLAMWSQEEGGDDLDNYAALKRSAGGGAGSGRPGESPY